MQVVMTHTRLDNALPSNQEDSFGAMKQPSLVARVWTAFPRFSGRVPGQRQASPLQCAPGTSSNPALIGREIIKLSTSPFLTLHVHACVAFSSLLFPPSHSFSTVSLLPCRSHTLFSSCRPRAGQFSLPRRLFANISPGSGFYHHDLPFAG